MEKARTFTQASPFSGNCPRASPARTAFSSTCSALPSPGKSSGRIAATRTRACYPFPPRSRTRMKNRFAGRFAGRNSNRAFLLFLAAALCVACASLAGAQQKDKKKKKDAPSTDATPMIPMSDEAQIDYMISEMLGAWQVGDIDKLHKDYADDVSVVNGSWGPPVIGWTNYLAIYQQQRARMQQVRMDRLNTYIKVNGATGWACYQWDFAAIVDGQPVSTQGQTTVVLEKRNNHWVIVLNHTSLAAKVAQATPASTPAQQQPTKPESR